MFIIYGKDNCKFCEQAKSLLSQKGYEYSYLRMGVDYTREELIDLVPDAKTVPQIWVEDVDYVSRIGSYDNLVKYLTDIDSDVLELTLSEGDTVRVTFTKADGTERVMLCTKNPQVISERYTPSDRKTDRVIKESPDVARVFDLEKNEWRSFRYDSVKSYEVAEIV